jgi:hypothetical protein
MATGPNPLDTKYATSAQQARQDVMVGVSVVMTSIGGKQLQFSLMGEYLLM